MNLVLAVLLAFSFAHAAPRSLTEAERTILAHVVKDPDAWWAHVNQAGKVEPESVLKKKIERWEPVYAKAIADTQKVYLSRAQRDSVESASRPSPGS